MEYQWDYRNRLVGVVAFDSSGSILATYDYAYDINDSRIAKSIDSNGDGIVETRERYVLDGVEIALVFDGSGNQTERFFHGVGIDEVIAVEKEPDTVYWSLSDQQGTVRLVLDEDGNVANQISYDAFGNITNETDSSIEVRFVYTGRELDPETGLYYNRRRYLDSATGQFISIDTIGFDGGDTNLYGYVGNSPILYTDPSGNIPAPVVMFGAGFLIDSAIQVVVNRGFDNYDWKSAAQTGLSSAIGGGITGKLLGKSAPLAKKILVSTLVGSTTDGGLQLGRNFLEGRCNKLEDVGGQMIAGGLGSAGGELFEAGAKAAAPHVKNLIQASSDAFGGFYKGVKDVYKNASDAITGAFKNSADNIAKTSDEIFNASGGGSSNNWNWNTINETSTTEIIKQLSENSCGAACGQTILKENDIFVSQSHLAIESSMNSGVPGIATSNLKNAMNKKVGQEIWRGGNVPANEATIDILNRGDSWIALLEPDANPGHFVIVDGLDDTGNLAIRDPRGIKFSMTKSDFVDLWTDNAEYGEAIFKK